MNDWQSLLRSTSTDFCSAALDRKLVGTVEDMIAACDAGLYNWGIRMLHTPWGGAVPSDWTCYEDVLRAYAEAKEYWENEKRVAEGGTRHTTNQPDRP